MLRLLCFILGLLNLYNDQPGAAVFWVLLMIFLQLVKMLAWARLNRNPMARTRSEGFWM